MNERKYLWGFLTLVFGVGLAGFTIYTRCANRVNGVYDTSISCINELSFWIILAIATIIAIIGSYMCKNSN